MKAEAPTTDRSAVANPMLVLPPVTSATDGEAGFHDCQLAPALQATVRFYREI
jgi:hypothetical protein